MGLCLSSSTKDEKPVPKRDFVSELSGGRSHSLSQPLGISARAPIRSASDVHKHAGPRQQELIPVSALSDVLATLLVPKLHLQELKTLSHTNAALRAAVESMPDSAWSAAAAHDLPPQHPVLSNPSKDSILEYGRIHAALRSGRKPSLEYVPGSKAIVSAVSPNDQLMAIISRDGLLRFWAMQTRELLRITKATVLQFTGVGLTWAPDSIHILMVTIGNPRCVLARTDKSLVIMRQLTPGQGNIHRVLWAPDSQAIAVLLGVQETTRLLVIDTRLEPIWQSAEEPMRAAWAPDSSCLAYTANSNSSLELLLYERDGHPEAFWYERDDDGGSDGPARDSVSTQQARALAETWRQQCGASPRSRVLAVHWSGRGGLLLLTDEGPLLMQRLPGQAYMIAQTLAATPAPPAERPGCVPEFAEWSPCGDKACVVQSLPAGPELCMFSAETGQPLFSQGLSCPGPLFWLCYWRTPQSSKFCVSPDGKHLAVLDRAQTLRIVNMRTSAVQLRRESERNALEVVNMTWNTWGSQLYLQTDESSIQIYTFYAPRKPSRPSMSNRLLGAAASALNVPRPE